MTAKHTPGPWVREGNMIYALMHDGWRKGVEQFRNRFFAQVQGDVSCSDEEARANARLIAAAPELLASLSDVLDDLILRASLEDDDLNISQSILDRAQAAIAKATGSGNV